MNKEVSLFDDREGVMLERGEHSFSFRLLVPSRLPTYEDCPYGHIGFAVVAKAEGIGSSDEQPLCLIVNVGFSKKKMLSES